MGADASVGAELIVAGLRKAGIRTAISLPDTVMWQVSQRIQREPAMRLVPCAREDEGLAIAAGLWLGGELAVTLMEGSGIGLSGLILARMLRQRSAVLIIASHNRVFGEARDYHGATRIVGEGVLRGLGVAFDILTCRHELAERVDEAAITARNQREPIGLLVAPTVMAPIVSRLGHADPAALERVTADATR